ncbi:MAG: hypothetical protein K0S71_657 [Clostridia bacterium]|jgi:hypothetical protein|nr:hypothetical protein [Clostridia bacterium]
MFCTIRKRDRKVAGDSVYNIYLSERKRENGKVKSKDIFIMSISSSDIQNDLYKERVKWLSIGQEEKQLILDKLSSINVPLQDTTQDIPLQTTTRVELEIVCDDGMRNLVYKFYVGGVFIRSFDDVDLEHCRISLIMKCFKEAMSEQGITDKKVIAELSDKLIDVWEYHKDVKEKKAAEIKATADYFTNIIQSLQLELAMSKANNGSVLNHITTDRSRLKKIYKTLSTKLHPDNPSGSVEAMQMLNELKEIMNI